MKFFYGVLLIGFALGQIISADDTWNSIQTSLQDTWRSVNNFVMNEVNKVEDFFARTQDEMKTKVDDTVRYLEKVKQDKQKLIQAAEHKTDEKAKDALGKVDQFLKDTKEFQEKIQREGSTNWEMQKTQWETKSKQMYNDGLEQIIALTHSLKSTGGAATKVAVIFPLFLSLVLVF